MKIVNINEKRGFKSKELVFKKLEKDQTCHYCGKADCFGWASQKEQIFTCARCFGFIFTAMGQEGHIPKSATFCGIVNKIANIPDDQRQALFVRDLREAIGGLL